MTTIEKTSYFFLKTLTKAIYTVLILSIGGLLLLSYRSYVTGISINYTIPLLIESARNPALMLKYSTESMPAKLVDPLTAPETIGYSPAGDGYRWIEISYDLPEGIPEREIQLLTEENGVYSQSFPVFTKKTENVHAYYLILSESRIRALIYQGNILTLWK